MTSNKDSDFGDLRTTGNMRNPASEIDLTKIKGVKPYRIVNIESNSKNATWKTGIQDKSLANQIYADLSFTNKLIIDGVTFKVFAGGFDADEVNNERLFEGDVKNQAEAEKEIRNAMMKFI
jgi:hypothetical protein